MLNYNFSNAVEPEPVSYKGEARSLLLFRRNLYENIRFIEAGNNQQYDTQFQNIGAILQEKPACDVPPPLLCWESRDLISP